MLWMLRCPDSCLKHITFVFTFYLSFKCFKMAFFGVINSMSKSYFQVNGCMYHYNDAQWELAFFLLLHKSIPQKKVFPYYLLSKNNKFCFCSMLQWGSAESRWTENTGKSSCVCVVAWFRVLFCQKRDRGTIFNSLYLNYKAECKKNHLSHACLLSTDYTFIEPTYCALN